MNKSVCRFFDFSCKSVCFRTRSLRIKVEGRLLFSQTMILALCCNILSLHITFIDGSTLEDIPSKHLPGSPSRYSVFVAWGTSAFFSMFLSRSAAQDTLKFGSYLYSVFCILGGSARDDPLFWRKIVCLFSRKPSAWLPAGAADAGTAAKRWF